MNARGFFLLVAALTALLVGVGCGSSESDEIAVQTGSLSRAEFIRKADAICKASQTEFSGEYTDFVTSHQSVVASGDAQKEKALLSEMIESLLTPNIEARIKRVSQLGAPEDYADEVSAFVNTLDERLGEVQENPVSLTSTTVPFKKAEDAARLAGMNGCAESLS